jgi:hypothetical protein
MYMYACLGGKSILEAKQTMMMLLWLAGPSYAALGSPFMWQNNVYACTRRQTIAQAVLGTDQVQ